MLRDILLRFHTQQAGPTKFQLPNGVYIDLSNKTDAKRLTRWVLALFSDNELRAKEHVMAVVPRALTKSAPWPYLIRALWNMAESRSAFIDNNATYKEVKAEFCQLFGKSRLRILNELSTMCDDIKLEVCGVDCDLTQDVDRAALLSWLMRYPYPTFVSLSPQNLYDFKRRRRLGLVIKQVNKVILCESAKKKPAADKADVLGLIGEAKESCIPGSEYQEVLDFLYRFYTHCDHIYPQTFYNPYRQKESYLSDVSDRRDLSSYLKRMSNMEKEPDQLKADWLKAAVKLGIVTHPLNWTISVLNRRIDPVEVFQDIDWYDEQQMCNRYGLIPVTELEYMK